MQVKEQLRTESRSPSEALKDLITAVYHHRIYSKYTLIDHINEMGKGDRSINAYRSARYELTIMCRTVGGTGWGRHLRHCNVPIMTEFQTENLEGSSEDEMMEGNMVEWISMSVWLNEYRVINVIADGNCFYTCFAKALGQQKNAQGFFRYELASFMKDATDWNPDQQTVDEGR